MARRLAISGLCAWGALLLVQPDLVQFAAALSLLALVGGGLVLWRGGSHGCGMLLAPSAPTRSERAVLVVGPASAGVASTLVLLSQPRR